MTQGLLGVDGINPDVVLDVIERHAKDADEKAMIACQRSKYSVSDYWICVEMRMAALFDDVARAVRSERRCPIFAYRMMLGDFRRSVTRQIEGPEVREGAWS